jgi:UV DNA damage endonuclease
MKIGYPCINKKIGCTANSTFRLKNYSEENLINKVTHNLDCLQRILEFNVKKNLLFFRISSDLIPFASHPICTFNWQKHFKSKFKEIGRYIKDNKIRISMHPDQFVLINSPRKDVFERSVDELVWHCQVLDLMRLNSQAKVQIHVGGVYGNKKSAINNFIRSYKKLPELIKKRLTIENDDRLYSLKECLYISKKIKIPVIFDNFHHSCLNNGENISDAITEAQKTWKAKDGKLMSDYSSQEKDARKGKHAEHIDIKDFKNFIQQSINCDFDIMLEIKDKEKSALEAIKVIENGI